MAEHKRHLIAGTYTQVANRQLVFMSRYVATHHCLQCIAHDTAQQHQGVHFQQCITILKATPDDFWVVLVEGVKSSLEIFVCCPEDNPSNRFVPQV
jgi:hypothetical protein